MKVFTIVIGGAAGDGVREAGYLLGNLLTKNGLQVFLSFNYPSLIRGGHNFCRLSFSQEKVFHDHHAIDLLVALNDETVSLHRGELNPGAVVLADTPELSFSALAEEIGAPAITRSAVALGAICYLLNLPLKGLEDIFRSAFNPAEAAINFRLAEKGYRRLADLNFPRGPELPPAEKNETREFINGNSAFGKGLVAAGLNFYLAYPMTPATSLLHFFARQPKEFPVKTVQPEDEIAVINMALGIAYAGKRVAIGTATGGFALMQETFSLAGMAELPLVIMVAQRQGPATGVATHTSQADLLLAIHSGHGEFPRLVLAPGDPEEAFLAGADGLNLAWKYQLPVIVLLDKHLSEGASSAVLKTSEITVEKGKILPGINGQYQRYQITKDGISPLIFPGTPGAIVKTTSYEHDEYGLSTDQPEKIKAMQDKRFAKREGLSGEFAKHETVKVYGDQASRNVVIFWGSTKGAVLEAAKLLKKPVKLLQIIWLEPFNAPAVAAELKNSQVIIDVEANHAGQLASLIMEQTGIAVTNKILRYDAEPFDPIELAEKLNEFL